MQQFFIRALFEEFTMNTIWNMSCVAPLWKMYCRCQKKTNLNFWEQIWETKNMEPFVLQIQRAPCFLFFKFPLKNGDLFFFTPPIFGNGLIFWRILDFETLILQEFSKYHVKWLHFQKPDGVTCLKNVFTSYFVKS